MLWGARQRPGFSRQAQLCQLMPQQADDRPRPCLQVCCGTPAAESVAESARLPAGVVAQGQLCLPAPNIATLITLQACPSTHPADRFSALAVAVARAAAPARAQHSHPDHSSGMSSCCAGPHSSCRLLQRSGSSSGSEAAACTQQGCSAHACRRVTSRSSGSCWRSWQVDSWSCADRDGTRHQLHA